MKKTTIPAFLLIYCLSFLVTACQPATQPQKNDEILYQYSTISSLSAGVFDGALTYGQLKQHGDFGLGTFNGLDGEMVEVDGQIYQIKSDGVATLVDDAQKTPFAVVTYFSPDQTIKIDKAMGCEDLKTYLDGLLPTANIPYAVKVSGVFGQLQTRSVPKQTQPYPTLAEATKKQATFDFQNVEGVMVGFRLPAYMAGVNATPYHFHFITADHKAGGHVLKCEVEKVTVEIDNTSEWEMDLPSDPAFYKVDLSGK